MKVAKVLVCVLFAGILFSCGSKKKIAKNTETPPKEEQVYTSEKDYPKDIAEVTEVEEEMEEETSDRPVKNPKSTTELYIEKYAPIAKNEMELYGIPASITLAQGILESGSGHGALCMKSNNHFGIKCNGWEGAKVYHDDDKADECFRKYSNPKYSFRDHSLFLSQRRRYAFLFSLDKDDYKAWARGLKKAGYATDPRYPEKLIGLVKRYNLDRFDDQVLGNSSRKGRPKRNPQIDYSAKTYTVRDGDTLWNIAKRNNLTVKQLKKLNNLNGNVIEIGQKLYVETQ